ncbi:MAG: hypothetical protein ABL891_17305 [Burkholderiales bacterium]
MATCVQVNGSGVLELVTPPPSDVASCAYVMVSGTEYMSNPFLLTVEQGTEIGLVMMFACAVAWGVRKIADVFSTEDERE